MRLINFYFFALTFAMTMANPVRSAETSSDPECAYRTSTRCYSCDAPEAILVGNDENCTKVCPNRETNTIGSGTGINYVHNCVLKECPADKPLRGHYGECFTCDTATSWYPSNCEVCPNRYMDKDELCQFKDGRPLERDKDPEMQPAQTCPPDKPLQQWNNECFPCDTPLRIQIDSAYSRGEAERLDAVCPNRVIINGVGGNPPSLLPCPSDYPMMDYNELCYSCDEEMDIDVRYNKKLCARFCAGKRYVPKWTLSCVRCPEDKSKLNQRECSECGAKFIDDKCIAI